MLPATDRTKDEDPQARERREKAHSRLDGEIRSAGAHLTGDVNRDLRRAAGIETEEVA